MTDYITKPLQPEILFAKLSSLAVVMESTAPASTPKGESLIAELAPTTSTPDLDCDRLAGLEKMLSHNTIQGLLEAYLVNSEQRVMKIRDHAGGDLAEMEQEAHALAGMAANLGIARVSELAALLRQACKEGQAETALELAIGLREANLAAGVAVRAWHGLHHMLATVCVGIHGPDWQAGGKFLREFRLKLD